MAIGYTDSENYEDIAEAIRDRGNTIDTYAPGDMAGAILAIPDDVVSLINKQLKSIEYDGTNNIVDHLFTEQTELESIDIRIDYRGNSSTVSEFGSYCFSNITSSPNANLSFVSRTSNVGNFGTRCFYKSYINNLSITCERYEGLIIPTHMSFGSKCFEDSHINSFSVDADRITLQAQAMENFDENLIDNNFTNKIFNMNDGALKNVFVSERNLEMNSFYQGYGKPLYGCTGVVSFTSTSIPSSSGLNQLYELFAYMPDLEFVDIRTWKYIPMLGGQTNTLIWGKYDYSLDLYLRDATNFTSYNATYQSYIFRGGRIKRIYAPKVKTGSVYFEYANKTKNIVLPSLETIEQNAFRYCSELEILVIGNNDNPVYVNCPASDALPPEDNLVAIYVPDSLVDTYKAGTNWSAREDYFQPISQAPSWLFDVSDYDEEGEE